MASPAARPDRILHPRAPPDWSLQGCKASLDVLFLEHRVPGAETSAWPETVNKAMGELKGKIASGGGG